MKLEFRAQSVVEKKMLPNEWWGSCHEVTEGAALQSNAVTEGADCKAIGDKVILNSSLLTPNFSLQNTGGIL